MSARIRVDIQPMKYPSDYDFSVAIPLSEDLMMQTFMSMDFATPNADAVSKMLCTSPSTIKMVTKLREGTAKTLTEVLVDAILKSMGENDTVMGFKKEGR